VQESDGTPTDSSNGSFSIVNTPPPALISSLSAKDTANAADWSIQTIINTGVLQYGDRTYTFSAVPASVAGSNWIRTANDSKLYTGNPAVTFFISQDADVYVGHDDRIITKPAWLDATWTDTGENLTANGTNFSLYRKSFPGNSTVSIGPNGGTANEGMYSIVAKAAGGQGAASVNGKAGALETTADEHVQTKPNPARSGEGVTFFGAGIVPGNTIIKIYSLSGGMVASVNSSPNNSEMVWDGKNESGAVAAGIYVYTYESPEGSGAGKFTVVR
jgi:hypothetical protein